MDIKTGRPNTGSNGQSSGSDLRRKRLHIRPSDALSSPDGGVDVGERNGRETQRTGRSGPQTRQRLWSWLKDRIHS